MKKKTKLNIADFKSDELITTKKSLHYILLTVTMVLW